MPSATIRPPSSRTSRGKKCRGQAEVVEDGQDRRAVAVVEVDEQLHRRRPGDGGRGGRSARRGRGPAPPGRRRARPARAGARRATARGRPGPADARCRRARWPTATATRSAGRAPRSGSSCGRRPSPTSSSTRVANGTLTCCGTTAIRRAIVGTIESARRDRRRPGPGPRLGTTSPVTAREQGRLAGAVRSDQRDALAGRDRQVDAGARRSGPPYGDRDVVELDHSS